HVRVPVLGAGYWRLPHRLPEPTAEDVEEVARMVPNVGVDFGFAHDGDADRLVIVNRAGRVLPDSVCSILALKGLEKTSGAAILSENTSTAVEEEALMMGLRVVRSKVGKTFASLEK